MRLRRNCAVDQLGSPRVQLSVGELACPVNRHEQIQFPFFGSDLGDVDMDVPQRIVLERFSGAALSL